MISMIRATRMQTSSFFFGKVYPQRKGRGESVHSRRRICHTFKVDSPKVRSYVMQGITPVRLRVEHLIIPLGIDARQPRLSWVPEQSGSGQCQQAYQILVASSPALIASGQGDLWDSGRVASDQSVLVPYGGQPLKPRERCWWKVRVWNAEDTPGPWSETAFWGMGLFGEEAWNAEWIGHDAPHPRAGDIDYGGLDPPPCPRLRKEWDVKPGLARATLHVSALGLFDVRLNGTPCTPDVLVPGWTDFDSRVHSMTYDVTGLVLPGPNAAGVTLGAGWYAGYLGWETKKRGHYGTHPRLLFCLDLEYQDGTRDTVVSDGSWKAGHGPLVASDLYMGEAHDARLETPGWDRAGFDETDWTPVATGAPAHGVVKNHPGAPSRRMMELKPVSVASPSPGVHVFDLGQNMVGWVRIRVSGPAGTHLRLRFAEMLNPDGSVYITNLRGARAIDDYWLRGGGEEVWEPAFTFHGFRYVEVTGYPGTPSPEAITGVVVYSAMEEAGAFWCDHPLLNQLFSNTVWGQRGNFLEVPTDCPQRDERLGWMGDAQVFAATACLNMDTAAFFTKWMTDVRDAQSPEGAFPNVAPRKVMASDGAAAWGDAGVIVPWMCYWAYADRGLLESNFEAMCAWVDFLDRNNPNHLWMNRRSEDFGDWLSVGEKTPKEVVATAYFAYSARLVSEAAGALGRADEAAKYRRLFGEVRKAFVDAFVSPDGQVHGNSQTGYVLAIHFGLVEGDLLARCGERLVRRIRDFDDHLTTGFVGCSYLLFALQKIGRVDLAWKLLLNETYPSWLYPVRQGATTIWERWDGWTHDRGFQDPGMNSFNHYSFGSVTEWMYRSVAGINAETPGYASILLRPLPGGGVRHAKAWHMTPRGRVSVEWRIDGGAFTLDAEVPAGTSARVELPPPASYRAEGSDTTAPVAVTCNGEPVQDGDPWVLKPGRHRVVAE
jgi:alpha-L-rhamnosidase